MRRLKVALGVILVTAYAAASAEAPPRFPAAAVWHQEISQAPLHPQSASMITTLGNLGGFGNGRMQIDFGMHIVHAPADAPMRTIIGFPSNGEYYSPDCEPVGTAMPVPLEAYKEQILKQSIRNIKLSREQLLSGMGHLILPDDLIGNLGPAVTAGRSILMYGPPGNGKSSISNGIIASVGTALLMERFA